MSGFQQKQWKKSKKSKKLLIQKWPRPASPNYFMNLTLFGGTLCVKKTRQLRENLLCKYKIYVVNLWPRKHLMKMSHKEKFPDWKKNCNLLICKFTIKKGRLIQSRMLTNLKAIKIWVKIRIWIIPEPARISKISRNLPTVSSM